MLVFLCGRRKVVKYFENEAWKKPKIRNLRKHLTLGMWRKRRNGLRVFVCFYFDELGHEVDRDFARAKMARKCEK